MNGELGQAGQKTGLVDWGNGRRQLDHSRGKSDRLIRNPNKELGATQQ